MRDISFAIDTRFIITEYINYDEMNHKLKYDLQDETYNLLNIHFNSNELTEISNSLDDLIIII